ncbi:hypothetical protein H0H81_005900 [Sphagnurus paluster]|uniref:phosphatidate phosphatase n=1 Tax=Sphagnurus paluster TaxID=117069 RepID=A0A9P7G370_9AGAR|nr:hypothetical protein H0H81_005900 [Sphagnurus paluster]
MNYIRGAVSAISAPYQYYKDLPPINPSTLTGAIDVIVVQRPTDNGDTELVCSPFHVRFGKWQVLRPGEKKVNVSVNGHLIPFNMKIGEAGEAFFVFETDDDVPEDLITSPILQPTRPDEVGPMEGPATGNQDPGANQELKPDEQVYPESGGEEQADVQEPEFLDLDAQPSNDDNAPKNTNTTPRQSYSPLPPQLEEEMPSQALPSPPLTPNRQPALNLTPEMAEQDLRVDAALKTVRDTLQVPDVQYHHSLYSVVRVFYFNLCRSFRPCSRRTRLPLNPRPREVGPDGAVVRAPSHEVKSVVITCCYQGYTLTASLGSRSPSPVPDLNITQPGSSDDSMMSSVSFPSRAASEPPRDAEDHTRPQAQASSSKLSLAPLNPVQEYSWEWGAFPQPSPMKSSFGKGGRIEGTLSRSWTNGKGKADLSSTDIAEFDEAEEESGHGHEHEHEHGRSRSVPPELEGSPKRDRRVRELVEDHEEHESGKVVAEDEEIVSFGQGGTLKPSKQDSGRFILQIEDRTVTFELSIVSSLAEGGEDHDGPLSEPEESTGSEDFRGRRNRHGRLGGKLFKTRDEVEAARLFAQGKIDFKTFLEDDDIVRDPRLVIRWADDQYITRNDGSPLMNALLIWRDAALQFKAQQPPSHPTSPLSDEESNNVQSPSPPPSSDEQPDEQPDVQEDRLHHRSKSEPPEKPQGKPSSSSWSQWWSRSSRKSNDVEKQDPAAPVLQTERPALRGTTSAPLGNGAPLPVANKRASKEIPPSESAPAYPSTPVQAPVNATTTAPAPASSERRRYAKTLRLTSDQLKALNLKSGTNTITFSLSTSGTIACTARIFVWDSTDVVVVSDIDGTITKSDGLGHVFAMIGRDWTHLGVAKLYTDITRNGYKIMYLTSRAIGQADATRDYLKGIKQNDYQLPEGPVIMSPDRLMASLHREVIMRKPEVFKMACLRDIQRLFGEASRNPFYAGFGNRITDAMSYRSVNVPSARIFTIDSSGEVKMELLELAGYKSSYIHMTDLVDQMFPPIHRKWMPEFTDFNFWKAPVQDYPLPDLSPPSPALSARSDGSSRSTLARLRNFSLVGGRQGTRMSARPEEQERRNSHLRQISSFEKLSNTLGFSQTAAVTNVRRSASPESSAYDSEDDEGEEGLDADGKRRRRERRRSMTSMPGTLDEMHFGMDEEEEEEDEEEDDNGDGDESEEMDEEVGDEAFDEDLLAAGEMKNVPFL